MFSLLSGSASPAQPLSTSVLDTGRPEAKPAPLRCPGSDQMAVTSARLVAHQLLVRPELRHAGYLTTAVTKALMSP